MNRAVRRWLLTYAVAAVVYAAVDVAWIWAVANPLYRSRIPHLLAADVNLIGAGLFYPLYVVGIVSYGVRPHDRDATIRQRLGGAVWFGLFTYATWALTAWAVLDGFPLIVAVTDIAWGVAVCSLVTLVTVTLLRRVLTTA